MRLGSPLGGSRGPRLRAPCTSCCAARRSSRTLGTRSSSCSQLVMLKGGDRTRDQGHRVRSLRDQGRVDRGTPPFFSRGLKDLSAKPELCEAPRGRELSKVILSPSPPLTGSKTPSLKGNLIVAPRCYCLIT